MEHTTKKTGDVSEVAERWTAMPPAIRVANWIVALIDRDQLVASFPEVREAATKEGFLDYLERHSGGKEFLPKTERHGFNLAIQGVAREAWDKEGEKLGVESNGIALCLAYTLQATPYER